MKRQDEGSAKRGEKAMSTLDRILDISSRLDQLENSAEWIARQTVHHDGGVSQTGTLIFVLAQELRDKICSLVRDMETRQDLLLH